MAKSFNRSFSILFVVMTALTGCLNPSLSKKTFDQDDLAVMIGSLKSPSETNTPLPDPDEGMLAFLNFAVEASPEVAALRAAEASARSTVSVAISKSRPQVSASSTVGGYQANAFSGPTVEGASLSLTASQLLFDGGKTNGSISFASLELALAEAATQTAINRVSAEAASIYLGRMLAGKELLAIKNFKEEVNANVAQLNLMAQSGLIDRLILEEINGSLLELDIAEQEAKTALSLATLDFSRYFGAYDAQLSNFVLPRRILEGISNEMSLNYTPAAKEAALRVMLAEQKLDNARSSFSPVVTANMRSSSPMDPNESMSAQAGILLSYQLNDGGERKARVISAKEKLSQVKRTSEFQVEQEARALTSQRAIISKNAIILDMNENKLLVLLDQLAVADQQIQTGRADIAKVFSIKLKIYETERRLRQMRSALIVAKIDLAAALGLFSE